MDKGGATVILNHQNYIDDANREVFDIKYDKELGKNHRYALWNWKVSSYHSHTNFKEKYFH